MHAKTPEEQQQVVRLARTFGGGGHRFAAGYSPTGTAADVVAALIAAL